MSGERTANRPRLRLVHGPTPIVGHARLRERIGVDLWIKRDDMTGSAASGNKLRKLELLLADARAQQADTVVTCGALQSNHARATAVACASLGLHSELVLWSDEGLEGAPSGNLLLSRMAGARVHVITRDEYRDRHAIMQELAAEIERRGGRPYVIPEGGSNGLGALGYVQAMREVSEQMRLHLAGQGKFDLVAVACGSGGTAAGLALGAAAFDVATEVRAFAVCNDTAYFEREIAAIMAQARELDSSLPAPVRVTVDDSAKGPSYGVATPQQLRFMVEVARLSGVVLDPVYTGKAMCGLADVVRKDGAWIGKRVLFVHTGSVAAALAHGDDFKAYV